MIFNKEIASRVLDKMSQWSLYIFIFVLPFSKSMVEIATVVAIVSIVARKFLLRERIFKLSAVNIALYLFVAVSAPSFFNTSDLALSVRAFFFKTIKFAAVFLAAQEVFNTKERVKNFIIMGMLSCIVIIADGFIQHYVTHVDILHSYPSFQFCEASILVPRLSLSPYETTFLGFPTASFPFPNDFASWILVMIFPAAAFTFLGKGSWRGRVLSGLCFAGLFFLLVLTKARSAWIGFFASLLLLPLLKFPNIKRVYAALLVLSIFTVPFVAKKDVRDAILSSSSIADRHVMWANGWKIFKEHPVIGNGLNTFFVNYMEVREDEHKNKKGSYAHNCYLQMAADIGSVGLASFLGFVALLLIGAARSLSSLKGGFCYPLQLGLITGISAYLVHSFFDTSLYSLNLAALFWIVAGLSAAIAADRGMP
jgi:O-antigen ligase